MAAKRSTAVIRLEDGRVRVFVSYNRADQDLVQAMVDELRKAGHDIWLDALLRPGQLWWSEILDEIERADVVVLALSPEYLSAEACTAERRYAARLRRPVLPIAIRPIAIGALPGDLAGIQVCGSVKDLVGTLRRQKPPPPLPRPMPERPRPPLSELALMRDRMKEVPLDGSYSSRSSPSSSWPRVRRTAPNATRPASSWPTARRASTCSSAPHGCSTTS
jgi:hypothetical protein